MGTEPGRVANAASSHPVLAKNLISEATRKESVVDQRADDAQSSRCSPAQQTTTNKVLRAADLRARFKEDPYGRHEHAFCSSRTRAKSLGMIWHLKEQQIRHMASKWLKRLWSETEETVDAQKIPDPAQILLKKYGKRGNVLGWGAFGIVRISHKMDEKNPSSEQIFAVKEHKQHPRESEKHYCKRVTAEFCISSSLHHQNILATLDLLQDGKGVYCQIMEYFPGNDLHSIIVHAGQLEETEADCFFKQLIQGIVYMHEMGVAHRDLKPENIFLTQRGTVKIIDFGNAECFRAAWETEPRTSTGICGSAPYMAPEMYRLKEFDSRPLDVWASGMIYVAMRIGQHPWRVARPEEDPSYQKYVEQRKTEAGYEPIEGLRCVSFGKI